MPNNQIELVALDGLGGNSNQFYISPTSYTNSIYMENSDTLTISNLFGAQVIKAYYNGSQVSYTNLSYSKSTLTGEDAVNADGSNIRITVSYNGTSYTDVLSVVLKYNYPISFTPTLNADATKYYYEVGDDLTEMSFHRPTSPNDQDPELTKITVKYKAHTSLNPSLVEYATRMELASVKYYTTDMNNGTPSDTELLDGDLIDLSNPDGVLIWMKFTSPNAKNTYDSKNYDLWYPLVLQAVQKTISSVAMSASTFTVTKGNKITDYTDKFTVTVTYNDGTVVNNFTQYTFKDPQVITGGTIGTITVTIAGTDYTLDTSAATITVQNATISSVEANLPIRTSYELSEGFDFTDLVFTVHYSGTDYTTTASFDRWGNSDGFTVVLKDSADNTVLNTANDFNGTETFADNSITSAMNGSLVFTIGSPIASYGSHTELVSITVSLENIVSFELVNVYRDYFVGDTFLNSNDDTLVRVYYKDISDNLYSTELLLASGHPKILTSPVKGTKFNNSELNKVVRISSAGNSAIYTEYVISVVPKDKDFTTKVRRLHVEFAYSITKDGETIAPTNGLLKVLDDDNNLYGYIKDIYDENVKATLVLFDDYKPEIRGASNIEITFPNYVEGSSDEIDNCHFGVLFGANNAKNRLFLSGNKDHCNADWHSSEPNYTDYDNNDIRSNGNFSYFSDESIMYYGETDNEIIGYEVVSNDKLLVLKSESDKEKTVYFRNPTIIKAVDASGATVEDEDFGSSYQEEFSLTKGNGSVAGVSPKSIVNFNGDTLFIDSNKQLVGLDIAGIVGDNQRYANTRSQYVDRVLDLADLSDSILWTNNNYLFITVKDFGVLATNYKTFDSDKKQYEWFYLTSEEPTAFFEKDKVIYFANEKGELFKYKKNTYEDVLKIYSNYTLDIGNDTLTVASSIIDKMKLYDENGDLYFPPYKLRTLASKETSYLNKLFYKIASINSDEDEDPDIYADHANNCFEILNTDVEEFIVEDSVFYLSYDPDGSTLNIESTNAIFDDVFGVKFTIKQIAPDGEQHGTRFKLYKDVDGVWTEAQAQYLDSAIMCHCLDDEDADICQIDVDNSMFKLKHTLLSGDEELLDLVRYGDQTGGETFKAEIREYKNVEAFYITAPFVMGGLDYLKTVWSFTVTNDTSLPSQVEVAYASNKIPLVDMKKMTYISLSKEQLGMDITDFSFKKVDFDKTVVPRTYTTNRVLPRQKFICFAFKNYDNTNCVLSALSVTYTTPFPSYSGD